jgi:hypothetical protein
MNRRNPRKRGDSWSVVHFVLKARRERVGKREIVGASGQDASPFVFGKITAPIARSGMAAMSGGIFPARCFVGAPAVSHARILCVVEGFH